MNMFAAARTQYPSIHPSIHISPLKSCLYLSIGIGNGGDGTLFSTLSARCLLLNL